MRFSSPNKRFTVRDENERDDPVVTESDDFTSEEATLSDTREAERLISSHTIGRIIASMKPKWPSRRQHAEHMSSDRRERTGNNSQKLKLDCVKIRLDVQN